MCTITKSLGQHIGCGMQKQRAQKTEWNQQQQQKQKPHKNWLKKRRKKINSFSETANVKLSLPASKCLHELKIQLDFKQKAVHIQPRLLSNAGALERISDAGKR